MLQAKVESPVPYKHTSLPYGDVTCFQSHISLYYIIINKTTCHQNNVAYKWRKNEQEKETYNQQVALLSVSLTAKQTAYAYYTPGTYHQPMICTRTICTLFLYRYFRVCCLHTHMHTLSTPQLDDHYETTWTLITLLNFCIL